MNANMDMSAITSGLAGLNSQFNQLPLTPGMALGQSGLLAQLQGALSGAQAGYGDTVGQYNLGLGRQGTDEGIEREALGASLAARGMLSRGSGVAANQNTLQQNTFNRQRQDMGLLAQRQLAEYIRQAQAAYGNYGQGLSGLALESAQYSSGNPAY